ncbi:MAG: HNH endonuclease [Rhodocyclaceae bacterium]|nr:HNH endonuclease [Rhodocyclaceae bacterium]
MEYRRAKEDLEALESAYKELAADGAFAAAGWAPPPWGTAADLASLGRSLLKCDWGGAVFDAIGLIPIAGDAAKAGKLGKRASQLEAAIDAAKTKLTRHLANSINGQRTAAKKYWDDIITEGRKKFDKAIKNCSSQECKDRAATLIGKHYERTPAGGPGKGKWTDGYRGDGKYTPDPNSDLGEELADFTSNRLLNPGGKKVDSISYKNGFPDFGDLVVPAGKGKKAEVEIIQAGNHSTDYGAADEALLAATGKTQKMLEAELGVPLTWHHKEDGVTMQLLPEYVHGGSNGSGHAGGASLLSKEEF